MLSIDLGVFNKNMHSIKSNEALIWSAVWISLAIIFNIGVYYFLGHQRGLEFTTGYLLEYSLSVDNIFVFILLFSYFNVPKHYEHKVLFWGIVGAFIMRGVLIVIGATLIVKFHWIIFIFGIFLVITGVKMAFQKDEKIEPNKNPFVRLIKKIFPISDDYVDGHFFVKTKTGLIATPLLIVLVIIETTDLIFAFDSIPAILAITQDKFIVFTSNAFAILGLRSLYFALSGFINRFRYLKYGLSIILAFIGIKMLLTDFIHISTFISLAILAFVLTFSILLSFIIKEK
jgi:tellurite resistance protein TerC